MKKLESRWLYVPSFLLIIFLIAKFIEKTRIIWEFPFDRVNDLSSYLGNLYFLHAYGFHHIVPNWYNNQYKLFEFYPPAWYYFTYPFYLITKNVESAAILSFLSILIMGFLICWYFGKRFGFSKLERVTFFAFIFANPMAIGNFIRLGRPHELFSWTVFLVFFGILLGYKDRKLDKNFLWIVISYSLILLSHVGVFVLISTLFLSLILTRNWREWKYVLWAGLITAFITSFWWIGFLSGLLRGSVLAEIYSFAYRLTSLRPGYIVENVTSLITPVGFLILFYFYYKTRKESRDSLFFLPQVVLAVLFLSRLIVFVPFFNRIYPDIYNMLFIISASYMLFSIDYDKLGLRWKNLVIAGLVFLPIIAIVAYFVLIPGFTAHTQEDNETLELLKEVEGKFLILKSNSLAEAFYTYGAIYHNLSTPLGWSNPSVPAEYVERIYEIQDLVSKDKCQELRNELKFFNTTSVISYEGYCDVLEECRLKEKIKKQHSCLYLVR